MLTMKLVRLNADFNILYGGYSDIRNDYCYINIAPAWSITAVFPVIFLN